MTKVEMGITPETAELLREAFGILGVSVSQGIEHLAPFYVAKLWGGVAWFGFILLLSFVAAWLAKSIYGRCGDHDYDSKVSCMLGGGALATILFMIGTIGVGTLLGDAIGALASPEGYVLSKLLGAL